MTILLALDPGGTTGYSIWQYGPTEALSPLEHGQIQNGLSGFISWSRALLREGIIEEIVSESFRLDSRRVVSPDVTPLRIEGAIEALWGAEVFQIIWQSNVYKAQATDVMLKRTGLWLKGQEHARDSARHALALMKRRSHLPTLKHYWPAREEGA